MGNNNNSSSTRMGTAHSRLDTSTAHSRPLDTSTAQLHRVPLLLLRGNKKRASKLRMEVSKTS